MWKVYYNRPCSLGQPQPFTVATNHCTFCFVVFSPNRKPSLPWKGQLVVFTSQAKVPSPPLRQQPQSMHKTELWRFPLDDHRRSQCYQNYLCPQSCGPPGADVQEPALSPHCTSILKKRTEHREGATSHHPWPSLVFICIERSYTQHLVIVPCFFRIVAIFKYSLVHELIHLSLLC